MTNNTQTETLNFTANDWRTRFIAFTAADLKDELYAVRENIIRVVPEKSIARPYYLLDVFVKKDQFDDLRKTAYYSIDIINEFLSQIAIISYSPSELITIISTSPHIVEVGVTFEMILYEGDYELKTIEIFKDDIRAYSKESLSLPYVNLLPILKDAINSESLELKFLNFFSALDYIAQKETTQKVSTSCVKCGTPVQTHLATSTFLYNLFESHDVDKKKYNQIRTLRSKIAHGSGIRNNEFYKELRTYLPFLESIVLYEVSKRTSLLVKRSSNIVAGLPFLNLSCEKIFNTDGLTPSAFNVKNISWSVESAFTAIKNTITDPSQFAGDFGPGIDFENFEVDSLAWPY